MYAAIEVSIVSLIGAAIIGQAVVGNDWTHIASLPFAFAAAAFLIWSVVKLLGMVFDNWKAVNAETTGALRAQVNDLRRFQDDTLVGLIGKVSSAMERDAESSTASTRAWSEVHEDFRDLISALRTRSCLHDSDFPQHDSKAAAVVTHRKDRQERKNE